MNRELMLAAFAEEEIHTFQGRGGQTMTYIEDETVMDRLDAGYGFGNWQVQVDPVGESVVKVRLGVREHTEWVWYEDFGYPNREGGESLKEAVSDGIRRCGRFVGIARDLYRKAPDEARTGPQRPAPPRLPARTDPATVDPEPAAEPYVEQEEIIGRVRRRGLIRKGTAEGYKLDGRIGPEGHAIGFRLEVGPEKHIPQCIVAGPLGETLYQATGEHPEVLLGIPSTVAGILYHVRQNRGNSWYRLHVDRIETTINGLDVILPAEVDPDGPPDDVPLLGEAPTDELGLAV
jgi:hypothetical protein